MKQMLLIQYLSSFVYLCILFGVYKRDEPNWHIKIMLSCFTLDFLLILMIRPVKALTSSTMGFPMDLIGLQIILSVLVMVVYSWMIFTGYKLYIGDGNKIIHRYLAYTFLTFRTLHLINGYLIYFI